MKAKNYFHALKIIKSITHNTCCLWEWLFKLRDRKTYTYEQFIILAEEYDKRQKDNQSYQASIESSNAQVAHKKRNQTGCEGLYKRG